MKKRRTLQLITAVLTALLALSSCSERSTQPPVTYADDAAESIEDVFLKNRELGSCAALTGKVHFTAVLVSDGASSWNESDLAAALENLRSALDCISAEAEKYSAELTVSFSHVECRIRTAAPAEPDHYLWLGEALTAAGLGDEADADARLREKHSADSAPIVFLFNREGRAYASCAYDSGLEYCAAYTAQEDSLVHEILHMFGASDLYYPAEVRNAAAEHLGDSVMNRGAAVDPLTAYLVGWTEEPAEAVRTFFDGLTVTGRDIEQALAAETYTGFASREFSHGKYTGELVFGVADGRGKMTYNEGHVYDGEWKENLPHGTGSMTWAHGDFYMGEWKKGKRCGTGTYTWSDGTEYVGEWKDDKMHGRGIITYPDGSTVSGVWEDGTLT